MRIVQVNNNNFSEYYDEIINTLMHLRDSGADTYLNVETIRPVIQQDEVVNTKLSYSDINQIFCYRRALDLAYVYSMYDVPLYKDIKTYLTILFIAYADLGTKGTILVDDFETLIKKKSLPKDTTNCLKYIYDIFVTKQISSIDGMALAYLFTVIFSAVTFGNIPVMQPDDSIDKLKEYIYGN